MKRILILGAGFLQAFVIKRAREIGYYTIAVDKDPNVEGFLCADEHATIDIVDKESCLNYARLKQINGVLTAATDYGVLTAAYIAREMNLPGLSYDVARMLRDKYLVRKRLHEAGLQCVSQFYQVASPYDVDRLKTRIRFPVIVKPCDGSGSRAVERVNDVEALDLACSNAMRTSMTGKALIEDYISGRETGVEAFVHNAKCMVLGIMDKHMTEPPCYAELGHCLPSAAESLSDIEKVVERAVESLGVNFGAVNMDLIITGDNRICIIDIGARMGGNLIGSHIIPLGTGIDYMGNLIKAAVGDPIDIEFSETQCVATRLLALKPGRVSGLPDLKQISREYQVQIYHRLKVGAVIRPYRNNLDGYGYVVAVGKDREEVELRAEMAKRKIDEEILRDAVR